MEIRNTVMLVGSVVLLSSGAIGAQVKTIPGETVTMTATIEAIEASTRTLTIKGEKGLYETIQAPADMKRFSELKVGDKITARYYDNVVVRLKKPGEAAVDVAQAAAAPGQGQRPGGTLSAQRTVTVSVVAIDPKAPSITVKGPNGYLYSRRVADPKALAQVKVGDQLDVTWTEALLISVEAAK